MSARILSTSEGTNRAAFTPLDWALFSSISLIWGSSFLFMAIGLDAFHPGLVTLLRVGLGSVVLALVPRARSPIERVDRPRLLVLSLLWVAIPFTLFPIAQQWIDSAVAGMLNGAMPIFAAVIASLMLRHAPAPVHVVGLVVGFVGVVLISLPSIDQGASQAVGVVLVLGATLCYGLAVNIAAPLQQRYGSLTVMARMLALATLWTAPYGLYGLVRSEWAPASAAAVTAAGVLGTGIAFVIMGTLVGRVGSTRASFITYLIPVVALVLGVAFRAEQVGMMAVVGVVLVIAGAVLASRRDA
jgi:drug/metabolite transporter (DMT)-like permease